MEVLNLTNTEHFYKIIGHYLREGDLPNAFVYSMSDIYSYVINLNDFAVYNRGKHYIVFRFPSELADALDVVRNEYKRLMKDYALPRGFMRELKEFLDEDIKEG